MNNLLERTKIFQNKKDFYKRDVLVLQEILKEHNRLYYNEESPIISDKEYDDLFKKLIKLEEELNIFDAESPTNRIAVLVSDQFQKGIHKSPMISLDNTYDEKDLIDFEKRIRNIIKDDNKKLEYYIEFKFDGLGLSLTYNKGKLIKALTRGNGIEGEDVTVNAMQLNDEFIPKQIPFQDEIEIRGEIILSKREFERINKDRLENGEKLFANPRNAASGSLRQIDYRITKSRNLSFYAYSFPYLEDKNNREKFYNQTKYKTIETYSDYVDVLKYLGFITTQKDILEGSVCEMKELFSNIDFYGKQRNYLDFEIDGLVIKLNNLSLWQTLGTTEHHPRYAIAYKFPAMNVRTQVLDIEHSVGRTGIVTPIAHLEPVNVSGVVVRRATLHNYDELTKKDVRIGDNVFIVRAGEVIPEVISVIIESRTGEELVVNPPELCPSCNTPIIKDEGKVAWYCPNKKGCPAQTLGSLISFVSKHGANIEGLGDKIIEIFIDKGFITDFSSIFKLARYREEILILEGFKDKRIQNILDEVEIARNIPLNNFFVALGIPQIGKKTAKTLLNFLNSSGKLDEIFAYRQDKDFNQEFRCGQTELFLNLFDSLNSEELETIKDIGPVGAHSIVYYFEEYRDLVRDLLLEINFTLPKQVDVSLLSDSKIAGKSFCVTGSFSTISRDEIHKIIEDNGGETRSSVSSNLDYLIVGESAGSKLKKAQDLGVQILSLDEFMEMV